MLSYCKNSIFHRLYIPIRVHVAPDCLGQVFQHAVAILFRDTTQTTDLLRHSVDLDTLCAPQFVDPLSDIFEHVVDVQVRLHDWLSNRHIRVSNVHISLGVAIAHQWAISGTIIKSHFYSLFAILYILYIVLIHHLTSDYVWKQI